MVAGGASHPPPLRKDARKPSPSASRAPRWGTGRGRPRRVAPTRAQGGDPWSADTLTLARVAGEGGERSEPGEGIGRTQTEPVRMATDLRSGAAARYASASLRAPRSPSRRPPLVWARARVASAASRVRASDARKPSPSASRQIPGAEQPLAARAPLSALPGPPSPRPSPACTRERVASEASRVRAADRQHSPYPASPSASASHSRGRSRARWAPGDSPPLPRRPCRPPGHRPACTQN